MDEESGSSTSISVNSFVAARAHEIAALSLQIRASSSVENKGLAFQHVPKHMRRRAVSHNVKRLPKRLQQAHIGQLAKSSGGPRKKPTKPSRKHRRRKSKLLAEYNRRQRTVKWLETHIWHAKRFHVETKWNYRIPISPCDKGYRAIYRAFRDYCAMRDISFYSCLEINGPSSEIIDKFRRITSPLSDPLGIGARYYRDTLREGTLHIYADIQYPFGYIGQIKFSWVQDSILWLWVHPGYKSEVIDQLVHIFQLSPQFVNKMDTDEPDLSLDEIKLQPKGISSPNRWVCDQEKIVLTDLQGALNRIQLIGEETFSIMKQLFHISKTDVTTNENSNSTWFQHYFKDKIETLRLQRLLWDQAENSYQFPCQTILPLTVRDPRLFLPKSHTKYTEETKRIKGNSTVDENFDQILKNYQESHANPLMESHLRERILKERMSDADLSHRRGQLLIPGSELDLKEDENQVPIFIIHQGGTNWDLVLPAGWGLAFWIALSYRCVRAFGHRDAEHYVFEYGSAHSSEFTQPDSFFGQQEAEKDGNQAKEKFFSYPPAKRENLVMLKCPFPFQIDWNMILNDSASRFGYSEFLPHSNSTAQFFVLRDTKILSQLSMALKQLISDNSSQEFQWLTVPNESRCLIGIGVKMNGKGRFSRNCVICMPANEEDVVDTKSITEEPQDCTQLEMKRKELRQKHNKQLAFLRKKRKKIRKRSCGDISAIVENSTKDFDSSELSRKFNEEIQNFHIPEAESTLNRMSRIPFGFVTMGGESYRIGKVMGFGYVTLVGLRQFLRSGNSWGRKNVVLVRDAFKSLEYRQATLEVFQFDSSEIT